MNTPVTGASSQIAPQVLGNLVQLSPVTRAAVVNHYNVQPVMDVYASTQGRDLGGVASDIMKALKPFQDHLPRGTSLVVRGQVQTMESSFFGLGVGLLGAIVLVYLLIVVNFQSWLDPFIIITALPGALAVSLSRDRMNAGAPARQAALEAGHTRIRPVIMTALAMIIGMVPMALGMGEGGEQNAPLGRAVIGGLLFATVATLFFVPSVFTIIHGRREARERSQQN
jgi:multidrug efflux pump subunit AcrB